MANMNVIFVHGMFMTPLCWEHWEPRFRARGHTTQAPAWPEHDAPVEELRKRHPSAALGALTLDAVLEHFRPIARAAGKPVLIGHSMGGLIVQRLLAEGLGAAAVAIDSAPPKGVISLRWSFLKSNWPAISPFANGDQPVALSFEQFSYAFVNGLPPDEQRAAYDRYCVPESRRVGKGPTTPAAAIDFSKASAPLLLIAGENDHIIPASLNRSNQARYAKSPKPAELQQFAGRTHFIIGQKGWEEVADFALDWIAKLS
jgi:pimeloyl-ACP methyl ester carboxylesterase